MTGAYVTGSGSMKVDTSEASEEARTKFTDAIMEMVWADLNRRGKKGGTAREVASSIGVEKGRVSTAITNMYIMDHVARLDQKRQHHYVHVLPKWIAGRETIPYEPQAVHLHTMEGIVRAERLAEFLRDRGASTHPVSLLPQTGDHEVAKLLVYAAAKGRKREEARLERLRRRRERAARR